MSNPYLQPPLQLPLLLQRRSTDEFMPPPTSRRDRWIRAWALERTSAHARRVGWPLAASLAGRMGTASALAAINRGWGREFYAVRDEDAEDPDAAEAALRGDELVFDVQTHYVAPERAQRPAAAAILAFIQGVAPERWKSLAGAGALSLAEYLRCIFLESETAVAVLTSAPGEGENNILTNAEIAGTRELIDRLAGTGRLLHHSIVHPNLGGELEAMESLRDRYRPSGWKVYTLYGGASGSSRGAGWMLDDERVGFPFLERCRELGIRIACAHKGLSALMPTGSPADIGPAAAAFPDIDFLVYHSGYEITPAGQEEGPYPSWESPASEPLRGTDRLVASLEAAAVAPGSNVFAELGSTWTVLIRRPWEAAHVLGKLLRAVGEDNVLWGTDSIWYGSPQPLIDAFRAFRIPDELCERHGYPPLTRRIKAKILGLNAARIYGVDAERARIASREDDLAWVRAALDEARTGGTPRL